MNFKRSRNGGCLFKLIKLAIFVVIVLGVAAYFSISYIADYALKNVTAGTGIDAGVGSVGINLTNQQFDVRNFYITNPPNYRKCNAIAFKDAFIDLDVSFYKLVGQKTIVVDEVRVVGLFLNMDMTTGQGLAAITTSPKSNISEIADILQKSVGIKQESAAAETKSEDSNSEPLRFIIKKIVFADGSVTGSFNGKGFEFPLPSFTVENIGVREDGITGGELAVKLTGIISSRVTIDAIKYITKESVGLGKDAAATGANATEGAAKSIGDAIGNLFK